MPQGPRGGAVGEARALARTRTRSSSATSTPCTSAGAPTASRPPPAPYFDTSAADLDLGQAALLVGLLRSPETADPVEDMDEARARRASVLADMVDNDAITQAEADAAAAAPIEATDQHRAAAAHRRGGAALRRVGAPADRRRRRRGRAVRRGPPRRHHARPRRPGGRRGGGGRGAHRPGRARRPRSSPSTRTAPSGPTSAGATTTTLQVDLARGADGGGSGRQPGSTFKPFVLQAALEHGATLGDRYPGPPQIEVDVAGTPFPVENYGGEGFGDLTLADATKHSVNTVYAQLLAEVGPEAVADAAQPAGIDAELDARALDRPRRRGGQPARPGQRLPHLRQRRHPGGALRHRRASRTATATCSGSRTARSPRRRPSTPDDRPHGHRGPARRHRERHRHGGRHRPPGRRQDRHHPGQRRRLVRRLRPRLRRRRVDGLPRADARWTASPAAGMPGRRSGSGSWPPPWRAATPEDFPDPPDDLLRPAPDDVVDHARRPPRARRRRTSTTATTAPTTTTSTTSTTPPDPTTTTTDRRPPRPPSSGAAEDPTPP